MRGSQFTRDRLALVSRLACHFGGGGSSTQPTVPEPVLNLLTNTTNMLSPVQADAWGKGQITGWQGSDGKLYTPEQLSKMTLQQRANLNPQPVYAPGGGADQWTTPQTYQDYFGNVATPDTFYAAKNMALGGNGIEGYTSPSLYEGPAAAEALLMGQIGQLPDKFSQDWTKQIAPLSDQYNALNRYTASSFGAPSGNAAAGAFAPGSSFSGTGRMLPGGLAGSTAGVAGNAAGWKDTTAPSYEGAAIGQSGKLQSIGAQTPDLGSLASSINTNPLVKNALSVWSNTQLPTLQNQAGLMGLGRSNSLLNTISNSQQSFLQPIVTQALNNENDAINRQLGAATTNANMLMQGAANQAGRENTAYTRAMDLGNMSTAQQQAQYDAANQELLRQQGVAGQNVANTMAGTQNSFNALYGLSNADTQRKLDAASNLLGLSNADLTQQQAAGNFDYQDYLRRNAQAQDFLFQPLGGATSLIGSKTTGGK